MIPYLIGLGYSQSTGRSVSNQHLPTDRLLGARIHRLSPAQLAGREYVYVWVDGVHFNIRLEDDRLCTLVMIGARPDGEKELLAVEDGYRESAESWKSAAARSQVARNGRAGGSGRRQRAGILAAALGLARDPRAGLLVP